MKKTIILILYALHLLLMISGLLFVAIYFIGGKEVFINFLGDEEKALMSSFNIWHIVVAAVYPAFLFFGIHFLYTNRKHAALLYCIGCIIYITTNLLSYLYSLFAKVETTASLEDLGFSILFILISISVYFLAKQKSVRNIA